MTLHPLFVAPLPILSTGAGSHPARSSRGRVCSFPSSPACTGAVAMTESGRTDWRWPKRATCSTRVLAARVQPSALNHQESCPHLRVTSLKRIGSGPFRLLRGLASTAAAPSDGAKTTIPPDAPVAINVPIERSLSLGQREPATRRTAARCEALRSHWERAWADGQIDPAEGATITRMVVAAERRAQLAETGQTLGSAIARNPEALADPRSRPSRLLRQTLRLVGADGLPPGWRVIEGGEDGDDLSAA